MTAIWLLSTRGRPKQTQQVLDACTATGMTSPGVVYVDEDTGLYDRLKLPPNWTIHKEPEWLSLQGALTWCLETYPGLDQYGWLADDTYPRTPGWDITLQDAAADWYLACADDQWMTRDPIAMERISKGTDLTSGLCWGGKLIREVGWWAIPGVRQAGIDTAWCDLVGPLHLHRYLPNVVVEHKNWRTGKRPKDEVDNWHRDGVPYVEQDIQVKDRWAWSEQFRATLTRLAEATHRQRRTLNTLTWAERVLAAQLLESNYEYALEVSRLNQQFNINGYLKASAFERINELQQQCAAYARDLHANT